MKISIKREQSQTGLSFAEREKFGPKVKKIFQWALAAALICGAVMFTSCSKSDDIQEPVVNPEQPDDNGANSSSDDIGYSTLNLTSPAVGQLIGSDGKNYTTLPSGVTAVAMIAYVSGSNGLALALTDDAISSQWSQALDYAAAHTPVFTGGTWEVPSLEEWKQMFTANGGSETSAEGLQTAITNAGGESVYYFYWTRTETDASYAYLVDAAYDTTVYYQVKSKSWTYRTRSVLVW